MIKEKITNKLYKKDFTVGMPKQSRKDATDGLNSKFGIQIAEHLAKLTIMPNNISKKHWIAEISTFLEQWMFSVSSRSAVKMKSGKVQYRIISKLYYNSGQLMKILNLKCFKAFNTILTAKEYINSKKVIPPNFEDGDFTSFGFELKQIQNDNGINIELYKDSKLLCSTENRLV